MACLAQSLLDCEDFPGQTSHWRGVALSGQTWSGLTLERGGTPYLPPPPPQGCKCHSRQEELTQSKVVEITGKSK